MKMLACWISFIRRKRAVLAAAAVLVVGMWLSTGTLAPYVNTLPDDGMMILVTEAPCTSIFDCDHFHHKAAIALLDGRSRYESPCVFLYNCDHFHHKAAFTFLDSQPRSRWEFSVVLRRILFPFLAYPFMKVLGYETGGVLFGMVLTLLVFWIFIRFMERKYSYHAAVISAWMLAVYPGIMYWIGTPYSYAAIVPFTLIGTMVLFRIAETDRLPHLSSCCLGLGILFTGYDLAPFFIPAALIILFCRRKFLFIPLALLLMVIPSMLVSFILHRFYGLAFENSNTAVYFTILRAYGGFWGNVFNQEYISAWLNYIWVQKNFILVFIKVFFRSNFYVLPALFLCFYCLGRWRYRLGLNLIEMSLVWPAMLLFLFNNLAPEYIGWQMRGDWIARLYQPVFVVLILYVARVFHFLALRKERCLKGLMILFWGGMILNAGIVLGPITKNPIGAQIYLDFYTHAKQVEMVKNLEKYGRRPLGICKETQ